MLILITARLIIHNFNQREVEFQELELLTEDETKHEHRAPGKLTKNKRISNSTKRRNTKKCEQRLALASTSPEPDEWFLFSFSAIRSEGAFLLSV